MREDSLPISRIVFLSWNFNQRHLPNDVCYFKHTKEDNGGACCQVQVIEELCLAVDVIVLKSLFLHEHYPLPL